MNPDPRALLLLGTAGCWILAAAIEFQMVRPLGTRLRPDQWTLGLLAQGIGLGLICARGAIPDFWSISLANVFLMSTPLFFYAALQRMRGAQTSALLIGALSVGVGIVLPIVGFSDEAFAARAIVVLCVSLFGLALSVWSASQIARTGYVAGASLIVVSGVSLAVVFAAFVRSVVNGQVAGTLSGQGIELLFYATNDAAILLSTLGYMDICRIARGQFRVLGGPIRPDSSTGLYNLPGFMQSGLEELHRARRRDYPVCAMAIRIDEFEDMLSEHGQAYADRALERVADEILGVVRIYDLAGRLPGNVIGVLMPELALAGGLEVAERIRGGLSAGAAGEAQAQRIEVSIGLCETRGEHADLEAVLGLAFACLERAGQAGGNRVSTPQDPL